MKVKIDSDEWYPVFYLGTERDTFLTDHEVPDEKVAEWKAIHAAFEKTQVEMRSLVEKGVLP